MIIKKKQTHTELVQYEHTTCFSPVKSTFKTAITNNFFRTWPSFTPELVKKHLAIPVSTTQGHLHQENQNLQSTKFPPQNNASINNIREYFKKLKAKQKPGHNLKTYYKWKSKKIASQILKHLIYKQMTLYMRS